MLKKRIKQAKGLKSVLLILLTAVKEADKKIYLIIDEYDRFANDIIAMGDGAFYKDVRTPEAEYEWLIELRYLKKSDEKQIEQTKTEGFKQLRRYANSSEFEGRKNLKKALIIFSGKSDYLIIED